MGQAKARKGARRMPVAREGDEGRGKLRKAPGRRKRPLIRTVIHLHDGGEPGELKHLSTLRKRKQNVIPPVVASDRGRAQTAGIPVPAGL